MAEKEEELQRFEELFRRYYPGLCQRVCRITQNMEAAEDIVQEVFIHFWDSDLLQTIALPESYLFKAALNKALNYTTGQKRRATLGGQYSAQQPVSGNNTEQELELAELQKKTDEAIASLPPVCRKVFLLSRYEEMSHKEIAEFLQISPNTVDNHIKKALSILRKVLLSSLLPLAPIYFTFFL
ncbi:RNA polymerase sigma-70 factor [Adhaeribacter aquaticus]|uniref:RNA polymerase sigma-70 factor n=1 Tax=Adhaeribacter aquaticus TaxID=299567 RepID=UPI0003F557EE|nr:RNA polymerase sigma-70 factor [Adhaeribacter aquaticus]